MKFKIPQFSIAFKVTILIIALVLVVDFVHYTSLNKNLANTLLKEREAQAEIAAELFKNEIAPFLKDKSDNNKLKILEMLDQLYPKIPNLKSLFLLNKLGEYEIHNDPMLAGQTTKDSIFNPYMESPKRVVFSRRTHLNTEIFALIPYYQDQVWIGYMGIVITDSGLNSLTVDNLASAWVKSFFILILGIFFLFIALSPIMTMMSILKTGFTKFASDKKADGNLLLTHRIKWETNSELTYVVSLFNIMADKIEEAYLKATQVRGETIPSVKERKDSETEMFLKSTYKEDIARLLELAKARNFPLTLLRFDLVHFNSINELDREANLGILAGAVNGNIRARSDRAYRIGEDKFALILTGTGKKIAEQRAVAITQNYFSSRFDQKSFLSFGIGEYNNTDNLADFQKLVESDLYRQKENYKED